MSSKLSGRIPARLALLMVAPWTAFLAGFMLYVQAATLHSYLRAPGEVMTKMMLVFYCAGMGTVALTVLFLFVAALKRSTKLLGLCCMPLKLAFGGNILWLQFGATVANSLSIIVERLMKRTETIDKCAKAVVKAVNSDTVLPGEADQKCAESINAAVVVLCVSLLVLLLNLVLLCLAAPRYLKDLSDVKPALPMVQPLHPYQSNATLARCPQEPPVYVDSPYESTAEVSYARKSSDTQGLKEVRT